ncbi:AAA family ATPase [Candidatus Falkowbacteria bacterium]|nr:AAA family ATPase [Candidatus Falkowbacteria bacterium]
MNNSAIQLNWPLLGNEHILNYLRKSLTTGEVSGSYVFVGPDDLGKTTVASHFAYSLLCQNRGKSSVLPCGQCPSCRQHRLGRVDEAEDSLASVHADLHLVKKDKEKKNVSIEQTRDLIKALSMSSFMNSYKIGIIKHADTMSSEAANALLKTLEEPRNKVVVILISTDLAKLPETIVSRSQVLRFHQVSTDVIYQYLVKEFGIGRVQAKNLARLSLGRPALAVKFLQDQEFYQSYFKRTESLLNFWRMDLNGRFAAINEMLGPKASGQEAAGLARRILETWQGLARDLILCNSGQVDLVQHEIVREDLELAGKSLPLPLIMELLRSIKQAEDYLRANVNPKSALEYVAMSV